MLVCIQSDILHISSHQHSAETLLYLKSERTMVVTKVLTKAQISFKFQIPKCIHTHPFFLYALSLVHIPSSVLILPLHVLFSFHPAVIFPFLSFPSGVVFLNSTLISLVKAA